MTLKAQPVLLSLLLFTALGCTKDPAKIWEAKSLAICDCETTQCVQDVIKEFKPREDSVKGASIDDEQQERIGVAQDRMNRCLEKLGYTQ